MPLQKNQILSLEIESLSSDGAGVARCEDGMVVFIPGAAPGDRADIRIVKPLKSYAFGRIEKLLQPGPGRIDIDCPVCAPCGGCCFRHLDYAAECSAKEGFVRDAFSRLGGLDAPVLPLLPSPLENEYRNKVQYPVGQNASGDIVYGFYAGRSHRIVPCGSCRLQPPVLNELAQAICHWWQAAGLTAYDEHSRRGLLRHIFLRRGHHSGEILVCLVLNGGGFAKEQEFVQALTQRFPAVQSILLNQNREATNVILGPKSRTLYGPGYLRDTLCGVPVEIGPHSFYQVNTPAAEALYGIVRRYAALKPSDLLLDLYCGMGTIGLSMVQDCRQLIGVEIVPEAIASAKHCAAAMGLTNAHFYCEDAGAAAQRLAAQNLRPDVIILDPPRKGCDEATRSAVVRMAPQRIVMVSCNAATAARDCAWLAANGYRVNEVQPVDLFPRTRHVETVVLMSRAKK